MTRTNLERFTGKREPSQLGSNDIRRMYRAFKKDTKQWAKSLPQWRVLSGKYKSPKGFEPWNETMAAYLTQGDPQHWKKLIEVRDEVGLIGSMCCAMAARIDAPGIYISEEMLKGLCKTEVPVMDSPPNDVWPAFFLMLPRGMVRGDRGELLSSLLVCSLSVLREYIGNKRVLDCGTGEGIVVSGISEEGVLVHSYELWNSDHSNAELKLMDGVDVDLAKLQVVANDLSRLAKNVILLKNHQPELLTTEPLSTATNPGLGFGQQVSSRAALPITWLGKNFVLERTTTSRDGEERGPVKPHWRRGHWHTVCHGPKRSLRKSAWFQPVYVTGQHGPK